MTLYPYQEEGADFLRRRRRGYLGDEMGLGKTVQAAVAASRIARGGRPFRALAVAPASTLDNWEAEWARWGPSGFFVPVSYASRELRQGAIDGADWDLVILDEAHYAKNPRAKRTLAALNVARGAPRSWLLSGTPMPNHPGELWPAVRALWPGIADNLRLYSYDAWFDYFCEWTLTKYGKRPYAIRHASTLQRVLDLIMLRRTVADVELELPPLRVDVHRLPHDGTVEGWDLERALAAMEAEEEMGDEASLSRLRRLLGEYKAPRVAKVIDEELRMGLYQQVVVLAYHRSSLDALRRVLGRYGVAGFDGSTPSSKRQAEVDRFTHDPSTRVFIAQQTAAGIGINLQVSSEVVL
ncbi:MAG TPA: DEAD/DEAH box helicase, partial [Longimicrobiales bacterium]|nr:DEAD/DEAH box helicase [Longimicrobiales bacterium]